MTQTVYQRLEQAADQSEGCELSAEDVRELAADGVIEQLAHRDRLGEDDEDDEEDDWDDDDDDEDDEEI